MKENPKIKIWFTDFYKGFNPYNNFLLELLKNEFDFELNRDNPRFLIYSCYGTDFLNYSCSRIYYTGENLVPDFNLCDFAIGFHHLQFGDRYLRFPNYRFLEDQFDALIQIGSNETKDITKKINFCNFIYSNAKAHPARDEFFHLLSQYKSVSSPGSHLNNMQLNIGDRMANDWMYSKLDFQRTCKFSIAFENSSTPGYVTEKIMHAFITNTIPIYWGDPEVIKDFNSESFINCHDFKSFKEVVEYVKEVDSDLNLYSKIQTSPAFKENRIPDHLKSEKLIDFFRKIFSSNNENMIRRPLFGACSNYENNLRKKLNKRSFLKRILK